MDTGIIDRDALPANLRELYREPDSPYHAFEQEHRSSGALALFRVRQDAVESVDPATRSVHFVHADDGVRERGELHFGDGWRTYRFGPGLFDIQPAYQACEFRIPALDLTVASIEAPRLSALLDENGASIEDLNAWSGRMRTLHEARPLVDAMWRASAEGDVSGRLLVEGAFLQLLGLLLRERWQDRSSERLPTLSDPRLGIVIDYIEAHLTARLDVERLASVAHLSVWHFARAFGQAVGETPHRYVMRRRLERSCELLRATTLPLAAVADLCGFASQSHWTRRFVEVHGVTPGRWRAEARR